MKQNSFLILCISLLMPLFLQAQNSPDVFKTKSGKEVQIHCIKHGSLMVVFDNQYIQIDPVLDKPVKTDYAAFPKADLVLITHEHGDHLDAKAIETVSKASTEIYLNKNSQEKLGKGKVMANGDKLTVGKGIHIEAVPAYNIVRNNHPKGVGNGYILTMDGFRLYIGGDTEDIPELKDMKDIDVAFLPCNQPYTMTPEQLANAAKLLKPKVLYPYHYSQTPMEQVENLLKDSGIDLRIRKM